MAKKRQKVRIISCADDPRAAGRTGEIVDEAPPGKLTQGRWTVKVDALLIGPVLCHPNEIHPI
ncbi:hypothetical protein [Streptomyces sp. HGB0020]|jgi:hypothetical protein|uniref:hypothetical protein n=1 Tax=Streptomyces sp. HGB0020 TaxID=1078086 RepID=UPI00034E31B6|nr:hypothetical protein [Streptomyces sp. HGB0020]EPD56371.1 hypothetical protein HMPREF1211_07491 [Streptomyces sp. HGB0020]